MGHNAVAIANYFIQKGLEESQPISPMKVQKLVYISHGWHWAVMDEALIDDKIGAWPFGPVIGSIYKAFAKFSKRAIGEIDKNVGLPNLSLETQEILDTVWEKYRGSSATALSNMTHQKDSPWDQTHEEGKSNIIDDALIKAHYKKMLY